MRKTLLAAALLAAGPAPAPAADLLPPYAQGYEPTNVDERGLWMEMDELEKKARDSPFVIHDAALHDYVQSILCRTVGEDRCRSTRIYVLRLTSFNAAMYPNGMMIVQDGADIARKIEAVFQDAALAEQMRAAARLTAENYSWDNIARQYVDLLAEILEERKAEHSLAPVRLPAH